jgi:signal transduction histidine kinase
MAQVLWPVACSLAAGVGAAGLAVYLRRYWGEPGAGWLSVTLTAQALFCLAYGASLLTSPSPLYYWLSVAAWAGFAFLGVPFLAFALAYTGRGHYVRSWGFGLLFTVPAAATLLAATNDSHGLVWASTEIVFVGGLTTAAYELGPAAQTSVIVGLVTATAGAVLLLDASLSYGPLYRVETTAVAVSTAPPAAGVAAWVFGVGPLAPLNLTAVLFVPHVLVDAYAFTVGDMFEYNPTTHRIATRTAVDDLESPVVVVDPTGAVVDLNDAALETFDVIASDALTEPLAAVVGSPVDVETNDQVVSVRRGTDRIELAVSPSELTDRRGATVGYTLVFQDITDERRREQRLDVLNRVLRHNLRNELNVVEGSLDLAAERGLSTDTDTAADDGGSVDTDAQRRDGSGATTDAGSRAGDEVAGHIERARSHVADLVALADEARRVERIVESESATVRVDLPTLLADVAASVEDAVPDATVTATAAEAARVGGADSRSEEADHADAAADGGGARTDQGRGSGGPHVPDRSPGVGPGAGLAIRTRPDVLRTVLGTLIEATLEHDPETDGRVGLEVCDVDRSSGRVTVAVVTDGVGIPDAETAAVRAERETALDHASGLDVWLVKWGVDVLGGDLTFGLDADPTADRAEPRPDRDVGSGAGRRVAATVRLPGLASPDAPSEGASDPTRRSRSDREPT